jgi:hypothetical protein
MTTRASYARRAAVPRCPARHAVARTGRAALAARGTSARRNKARPAAVKSSRSAGRGGADAKMETRTPLRRSGAVIATAHGPSSIYSGPCSNRDTELHEDKEAARPV